MKRLILLLTLFVILPACGPVTPITPTQGPTITGTAPISTVTPSQTTTPSRTPVPTATEWIKVYPTKKALVIYAAYWRNEYTINFIEWGDFYPEPYLILYEDGQLILTNSLLEKHLSLEETTEIMSKLQQLGFFALQYTYEKDSDLLFAPGTDRGFNPGPQYFITVNEENPKTIFYQEYREQYLIQPMREILDYLNSFSQVGTTAYQPDRLLASIRNVEEQIPEGETIIPWPHNVSSPLQRSFAGILYLEGTEALTLYKAADNGSFGYFSFESKNYAVYLRPILPHECHIYHYYETSLPEPAQASFTCDDW